MKRKKKGEERKGEGVGKMVGGSWVFEGKRGTSKKAGKEA